MTRYLAVVGMLTVLLGSVAQAGPSPAPVSASAIGSLGWPAITGVGLLVAALVVKYFKNR